VLLPLTGDDDELVDRHHAFVEHVVALELPVQLLDVTVCVAAATLGFYRLCVEA
jgi:hypothetical protein